jgi:hypothetical protein
MFQKPESQSDCNRKSAPMDVREENYPVLVLLCPHPQNTHKTLDAG